MILADKIVRLRKKNGWSQEELAQKMNVSRQAVSKWESAQTIPELEKILQLGALFGVTTDYLLKDDMELEEFTSETIDSGVRQISIEEAGTYLVQSRESAKRIAVGTFLCVLSPIPLLLLGAASEYETEHFGKSGRLSWNNVVAVFCNRGGRIVYLFRVSERAV